MVIPVADVEKDDLRMKKDEAVHVHLVKSRALQEKQLESAPRAVYIHASSPFQKDRRRRRGCGGYEGGEASSGRTRRREIWLPREASQEKGPDEGVWSPTRPQTPPDCRLSLSPLISSAVDDNKHNHW